MFTPTSRRTLTVGGLLLYTVASAALAQITLDGTLSPARPLPGPNYAITADLGRQVGGNLFHSFGRFSIHAGESATFSGPNSVSHIIGRVTGGQLSTIDGALRSTIPGASLYLLNPAGVLFEENASLDVPGSVHVSTADYLRLSDGGRFDARTPGNSVLTVAPVEAFGFLGEAPGRIEINGSFLGVPEGQTLSLIGGDLTLSNATLYAPAGRINIAAVASSGEVIPTDTDLILRGFGKLGTFTIDHTSEERSIVDLGEPWGDVPLGDLDTSGPGGGSIFIGGGQWVSRGGWVFAETYGDQNGRGIHVMLAGEIQLENNAIISTVTLSTGDAGPIRLDVGRLGLTGGSGIFSGTYYGTGRGGEIIVNANEAVIIAGFSNLSSGSYYGSSGAAGTIRITTPQLALEEGGLIENVVSGMSEGDSIVLDVGRLSLMGGSKILTSTYGTGNAGEIILNASEAVTIANSVLSSNSGASGNAGAIRITTPLLAVGDGGAISSSTYDKGNGGTINLNVGRLNLTKGGLIFADNLLGSGHGGEIIVNASEGVTITDTSALSTDAGSTGNTGNITVTTLNLILADGGKISARSIYTTGGNIFINADHLKLLNNGSISSSVFGDEQSDGGNVTINGTNFVALNGSSVTARAKQGKGGNILVNAEVFLHDAASVDQVLNASADISGNDGSVELNAPTTDISGSLVALNTPYLEATAQLSHRCGGQFAEERSRFVVQGRGALPLSPEEALPASVGRCEPPQPTLPPVTGAHPEPPADFSGFGDR